MIGQDILDLVKKPYRITYSHVRVVKTQSGDEIRANCLAYDFPKVGPHDIYYKDVLATDAYAVLSHEKLRLLHWMPDSSERETPVVPSVTIDPSNPGTYDKTVQWLTEEWFGDSLMQSQAKKIVSDICNNGCVIFDYHIDEKSGPLVHADTNLGRYIFPAAVFCPIFLRAKCFV